MEKRPDHADLREAEDTVDAAPAEWDPEEPIVLPIEDSIDLHTFQPREVKDLLDDYLEAASAEGFDEVLIIHGKGSGVLKARVHSILNRHPLVESFRDAEMYHGGWGATVAFLRRETVSRSTTAEQT